MSDAAPSRDELPIPDYDHLPVTGLAHRIRSLESQEIETLLAYERAHADRLAVVQALEVRHRELADGAVPSGGDAADSPLPPGGSPEGSKVTPDTQGPEGLGPAHGVPTNTVPDPRTP
jgi:hypothetical protein